MSESVIFDTNLHIKRITKTGVSQDTAEAFVDTVAHVLEHNLATKQDIAQLEQATKADIALLESRLIKWFVGTMIVFFSANVAVLVTLFTTLR